MCKSDKFVAIFKKYVFLFAFLIESLIVYFINVFGNWDVFYLFYLCSEWILYVGVGIFLVDFLYLKKYKKSLFKKPCYEYLIYKTIILICCFFSCEYHSYQLIEGIPK